MFSLSINILIKYLDEKAQHREELNQRQRGSCEYEGDDGVTNHAQALREVHLKKTQHTNLTCEYTTDTSVSTLQTHQLHHSIQT